VRFRARVSMLIALVLVALDVDGCGGPLSGGYSGGGLGCGDSGGHRGHCFGADVHCVDCVLCVYALWRVYALCVCVYALHVLVYAL
jgi:hypothetical protein